MHLLLLMMMTSGRWLDPTQTARARGLSRRRVGIVTEAKPDGPTFRIWRQSRQEVSANKLPWQRLDSSLVRIRLRFICYIR